MSLKSDIVIDARKFDPANNSEQANKLNQSLIAQLDEGPKWWEIGAAEYRRMRWEGETNIPAPVVIEAGVNFAIPSRDAGREIPCRVLYPTSRKSDEERRQCKGSVLHLQGGGFTLGSEKSDDTLCQFYADQGDLAVVSVGYRLAPEDPFPKGPEDCMDAGEWITKNSENEYGAPLRFIGGESAGAHFSLLVVFHLLKANPNFKLNGLLLHFGCYDLSKLPMHINMKIAPIIPKIALDNFTNAFLPTMTLEQKKSPEVSPYYEDLAPFRGRLPSALFTCGTEDPLLDDSVAMGTRWIMAGGETYVKIYTGAPHGFIAFSPALLKETGMALADTILYIKQSLAGL